MHRNSSQGERQPECSQCIWRKYYQDEVSRRLIAEHNNNTYIKVSIFFFIPINRNLKKRGKRGDILRGKLLGYNKRSIDLTSFFSIREIRLNSGSHLGCRCDSFFDLLPSLVDGILNSFSRHLLYSFLL